MRLPLARSPPPPGTPHFATMWRAARVLLARASFPCRRLARTSLTRTRARVRERTPAHSLSLPLPPLAPNPPPPILLAQGMELSVEEIDLSVSKPEDSGYRDLGRSK